MLSTLLRRGIEAEKQAAGKNGYTLLVDDDQLVRALQVLKENSLPREAFKNLGEVFAGDGMISSTSEVQARMSYALSQELADTLSRIDGVLTARVHVVLGVNDKVNNITIAPSAAVFLRHTLDSPVVNLVPEIRELVAGAVFRLTGNTVMPAPGVRVLRAADYARLVEANDVLAAARERAAAMAAEAEKAYEERRQAGYEDGLMEGRMEQAEKMMETAMQAVEYIEGVEAKLVGVVTSAVRKIIGELDDRECTVRVVRNALNAVRSQQRVLIRVSPDDKDAVRTSLAAMISSAPNGATFLDVTADPRMKPGDCILECELGVVDASLETQLKAIEHALLGKIRES